MRRTEMFNKTFKNMSVERAKEWHITTSKVVHKDKKKEANRKACRKDVQYG